MRSIPLAMTWEMLQRGKWVFLAALLGASALPGAVFGALRFDGALESEDPALLNIHLTMMMISGMVLGAAVMHAQGRPSRLYAFPVPTVTLVIWHLLPGMAAMVLMSVTCIAALNAVLDLGWPLWGPSLFLAVALAATQAALWLTEKSIWSLIAFAVVGSALGIWYRSRYGSAFSQPTRLWQEVTPGEMLTMLAVTALSIFGACLAIARDRCGEALTSPWLRAWVERIFDPAPPVGLPFRTPARAQFWFEWRPKGPILPAAVVMGLVTGMGCWLIFSRVPQDLLEGCVGGGAMLSLLGIVIGIVMGCTGPHDASYEMGNFLATRPMTDTDLARTILKTAGQGVVIAWAIWAVAFLMLYLILLACGVVPQPGLPKEVEWWYFPATLLGLWATLTLVTSLGLMGRPHLVVILFILGVSLFIGTSLVSKYVLSHDGQRLLVRGCQIAVGVAFVLGTAWAFVAARRRSLIAASTMYLTIAAWLLLCALVGIDRLVHPARPLAEHVVAVGLLTLALAPLAAAPLALSWNRHR